MNRRAVFCVWIAAMAFWAAPTAADVVIQAEQAAIRTEGGPCAGGGWNLWCNGRVGQPLRFAAPAPTKSSSGPGAVRRAASGRRWPCWSMVRRSRRSPWAVPNRRTTVSTSDLAAGVHEIAVALPQRRGWSARKTAISTSNASRSARRPEPPTPSWCTSRNWPKPRKQREREIVAADAGGHREAPQGRREDPRRGRGGTPVAGVKVSVEQTSPRLPLRLQHLHVRPLPERGPERRLQAAVRGAVQLRHGRVLLAVVRAAARQAELRLHRQGRRLVPGARDSA